MPCVGDHFANLDTIIKCNGPTKTFFYVWMNPLPYVFLPSDNYEELLLLWRLQNARLREGDSRNLEVCTLKVREDGMTVTQNSSPTRDFRDDLQYPHSVVRKQRHQHSELHLQ